MDGAVDEVYALMRKIDVELAVSIKGIRYTVIDDIDHDINDAGEWQTTYILEKDGTRHALDFYITERPYQFDGVFFDDKQIELSDVSV